MRTIIQNTKTGEYLRKREWIADRSLGSKTGEYLREGAWTADRSLARSFHNADEAVHYRLKHALKTDLQVIFQPGDEPSEWDVTVSPPINNRHELREGPTAGPKGGEQARLGR